MHIKKYPTLLYHVPQQYKFLRKSLAPIGYINEPIYPEHIHPYYVKYSADYSKFL